MAEEPRNLEQHLDRIGKADAEENQVSMGTIIEAVGRRSFGPLLLVAGLVTLAPVIGDIPGVPTMMGVFVLLTAGQLLLRRDHIWLPRWLLELSVSRDKVCKVLDWLRRPARFVDRWTHPRLTQFIEGTGIYVLAVACIAIALAMPFMEIVPFSANGAGAALTAFGLAVVTRDGLVAVLALLVTVGTFGVVVYPLL